MMGLMLGISTTISMTVGDVAYAKDDNNNNDDMDRHRRVIYKTGKPPIIPGDTTPKDKNDVRGTRKDPNFLRSIATCKSQCLKQGLGSDGSTRTESACLSECQDICCTTYEQCTFAIVPRI